MNKLVLTAIAGAMMMSMSVHAETKACDSVCLDKEVVALMERSTAGDTDATMRLGVAYWMGYGVDRDIDKAFKYISQAAEKEHPRSMILLSKMYEQGVGVKADAEKASELYDKGTANLIKERVAFKPAKIKDTNSIHKSHRSYQGRVVPKPAKTYVQPVRSLSRN